MLKKTVYRNALRSKKLIQDAFLALLLKKDLMKIKTQEVIALSTVSKGTFYAHYTCLFDVQQAVELDYLSRVFIVFEENPPDRNFEDFYPLFLCGLHEMEKSRELFCKFMNSTYGDSFLSKLKETFYTYMLSSSVAQTHFKDKQSAHAYFTYVAGGAIALIQRWLAAGGHVTAEEMAKFLNECAFNGINGIKVSYKSEL